jgi:hypothetical protein
VRRRFRAEVPNEIWVADLTEHRTAAGNRAAFGYRHVSVPAWVSSFDGDDAANPSVA